MLAPLRIYADGLTRAGDGPGRVIVRFADGSATPLALSRYLSAADEVDESVLDHARGPVLDVGCGPGRHLHALARRGVFALGVDLSGVAVELARGRGARAIVASIFDEIPGTGSWRTALLLDGNIGIGGAPLRLLRRIGALLSDDGELLVELDPPGTASGSLHARLELAGAHSDWFEWARLTSSELDAVAAGAGFAVLARWRGGDRWFARLRLQAPRVLNADQ